MQSTPFKRFQCWDADRVGVVINKEAVSLDRANFLATHAPLGHIQYDQKPHAIATPGEDGLLDELVDRSARDQHSFVVVQGIPGTGKSHLIRWLKEYYQGELAERGGNDVVLLIERAQCTLRGSIQQIIRSGVFDSQHMRTQLERLQSATEQLSSEALADNVLNQLQVVSVGAAQAPGADQPSGRIRNGFDSFLLDRTIREYLKRPGGPVERIRRYLAHGPGAGIATSEEPRFQPGDFDLPDQVLYALKEGYRQARELARDLQAYPKLRGELARYLNTLLNQAIGRMTALSTDDLKSMFSDLRRQLRAQGRGLALFIEDITAFTGIDAGLVDVLATQHTGEANTEFCRLLSVIGVTDSYYHDNFPTNIKERITHRLTLNASAPNFRDEHAESDLLREPGAIADLSARYLNAMRLTQERVDDWAAHRARPEHLPNACQKCPYREPCHAAFGAVRLAGGPPDAAVGLYPFNAQALETMYTRLKNTARTPRSLLQSVLAYVLQSHGPDVDAGTFPPPAPDLSADVRAPSLRYPVQRQTISHQAGSEAEAERIETLLLFWGDGTAYAGADGSQGTLGSVPEGVFTAFDVPFIPGEPREMSDSDQPNPQWDAAAVQTPAHTVTTYVPPDRSPPASTQQPSIQTAKSANQTLWAEDIEGWRRGDTLKHYSEFASRLAALFRSAIEWEDFATTPALVEERLQAQRFVFEGQSGQLRTRDHLTFSRSPKVVAVLHALLFFGEPLASEAPPAVAGHLARLSAFVHHQEQRVVDFVLQTGAGAPRSLQQSTVTVLDAVALELLAGGLSAANSTPRELLQAILSRCTESVKWGAVIEAAQGVRPPSWVELMKRVGPKTPDVDIWRMLLAVLNRPQGSSFDGPTASMEKTRRVYFLDVAPALRTLNALVESDWELPPLGAAANINPSAPPETERVYAELCQNLPTVLEEQQQKLGELSAALTGALGDGPPAQTLDAIVGVLRSLRDHQHPYARELDAVPDAADLEALIQALRRIGAETSQGTLALTLSASAPQVKAARRYSLYFSQLTRFLDQMEAQLTQQQRQLALHSQTGQLAGAAERAYADVIRMVEPDIAQTVATSGATGLDDAVASERRTG